MSPALAQGSHCFGDGDLTESRLMHDLIFCHQQPVIDIVLKHDHQTQGFVGDLCLNSLQIHRWWEQEWQGLASHGGVDQLALDHVAQSRQRLHIALPGLEPRIGRSQRLGLQSCQHRLGLLQAELERREATEQLRLPPTHFWSQLRGGPRQQFAERQQAAAQRQVGQKLNTAQILRSHQGVGVVAFVQLQGQCVREELAAITGQISQAFERVAVPILLGRIAEDAFNQVGHHRGGQTAATSRID